MTGGSAAGVGVALGALLTVCGLLAIVVGAVGVSLAREAGGGISGLTPGLAVAGVLVGFSLLAVGGTLAFGLR